MTIEKEAKGKKKLDPKAKVRNRGDVVFSAEHPKVTDHKDHFPLNGEDQARNALARASQYKKAPPWYSGSLDSLVKAVARAVHKKYKGIEISKDGKTPGKKKASLETPASYSSVLNNLIKLKASNEQDYNSAINAIKDKVESGEEHNGWTPVQLEKLLESVE